MVAGSSGRVEVLFGFACLGNKNACLRQDKIKIFYKFERKEGNHSETSSSGWKGMEKFAPSEGMGKANPEAPRFSVKLEQSHLLKPEEMMIFTEFEGGSEMFETEENGKGN